MRPRQEEITYTSKFIATVSFIIMVVDHFWNPTNQYLDFAKTVIGWVSGFIFAVITIEMVLRKHKLAERARKNPHKEFDTQIQKYRKK